MAISSNHFYLAVLFEELVNTKKHPSTNNPHYLTNTDLELDTISVIGCVKQKIARHNKKDSNQKETEEIVPANFVIGDEAFKLSVFPFANDFDMQEQIMTLTDGQYVHIDGIFSVYQDKAKITVLNIRSITDNIIPYLNLWYMKILKQRIGGKIPVASNMYSTFIKDQYDQYGQIQGDFFLLHGIGNLPTQTSFTAPSPAPDHKPLSPPQQESTESISIEDQLIKESVQQSENLSVTDVIGSPLRKKQSTKPQSPPAVSSPSDEEIVAYLSKCASVPADAIRKMKSKLGDYEMVADTLQIPYPPPKTQNTTNVSTSPSSKIESEQDILAYMQKTKQKYSADSLAKEINGATNKILATLIKLVRAQKITQDFNSEGNPIFFAK